MSGVLEGIRVLDFGRYIAGPFCGTMLADMGAEVIRIERVDGSEDRYLCPVTDKGEGAGFLHLARNKQGLTLNPMKPEAKEILRRLVATADVVVANLPLPTLKTMGIDYETLRAIKPDIILTHVSAFGNDGPYSERVGFDLLGQAMSGMMFFSGQPDAPIRSQVPFVDFTTALFAAYGTLAAIIERQKTGRGQIVEASLFSSALALNNAALIEQEVKGTNRVPQGNPGHFSAPNDAYRTKDGWIICMVVGNPLFRRWCELVGVPEWADDPRFAGDQPRADNVAAITERMQAWCAARTTEEAIAQLEEARVPAGPMYSLEEALRDPHARARGLFQPTEYPGLPKPAPLADTPVKLSETPGGIRQRPPTLGEHTDAILDALGFNGEEIAAFHKARAV